MLYTEEVVIDSLVIHKVGNRLQEEGVQLSKSVVSMPEEIIPTLIQYFFSPFKSPEYFTFFHETTLKYNELYNYISNIFESQGNVDILQEESIHIANFLYTKSTHPKIKSGELYVVYFKNVVLDGEELDGIGIFKTESKETYLKVYPKDAGYEISTDSGISLSKLDKGCIIFNTNKEEGYVLKAVDNLNKGSESRYWMDDFLKIIEKKDNYYHTKQTIDICNKFVREYMPNEFDITSIDQAMLLNESAKFFKEKENFNIDNFSDEVIKNEDVAQTFKEYIGQYERDNAVEVSDDFEINPNALKKHQKVFKSVLKLDKNFHIYIHGNRDYIQKGYDVDRDLNFYKVYYKVEE